MSLNNFNPNDPKDPNAPGGSGNAWQGAGGAQGPMSAFDPMDVLINYNEKFKTSTPIMYRDEVTQQTVSILIAKNKPNVMLIGSAGVGKTRIAEDLARRLANDDMLIPTQLLGWHIYELPLGSLIAGTSFRGQLEEKTKAIVEFFADTKNKAIMFIDEIHVLCSHSQSHEEVAQILKPALARGDIRCIGATTLQEANKLMDDPALNRRFSRVIVDEFTQAQTLEVLKSVRPDFLGHYGNAILAPDDTLAEIVKLADEYRPAGSHRPDNAITLFDRALGDLTVSRKIMQIQAQNNPNMLQAVQAMCVMPLRPDLVKRTAVRLMTGNAKKNDFDVDRMTEALSRIKGQDEVVAHIIKLLRQHDLNLFPRTAPMALLFAGGSGVGKTEITKIIAQELTGVAPITLNMTEYHSSASINRIIGSPAGYIGSDSNAELPFDCLESNPYQVILLDEFEKADRSVQRLFMSALDEGTMKTNRGKTVDFSRSIIIATTNAGQKLNRNSLGFGSPESKKSSAKAGADSMSGWFDTELLNRFQDILTFNDLDETVYREIVVSMYKKETDRILAERPRLPINPDIPDDELDRIVKETYVPQFGARPARKAVREFIESQV